jgi:hypothetical protein
LSRCIYTKDGKDIENGKDISFTKRAFDTQSEGTLARPSQGGSTISPLCFAHGKGVLAMDTAVFGVPSQA